MQQIVMYLRADSVRATLVDEYNQSQSTPPALPRGMRAELVLRLLDAKGAPIPNADLQYAAWDFAIADDWDTSTAPQIRVREAIRVEGNEVHIPLTEMSTAELVKCLGTTESRTLGCELAGYEAGETSPGYLLQFNIVVRNRRVDESSANPSPVDPGTYTAAQIDALFAAKLEVELSDDGDAWYPASTSLKTPETARWFRFRNAAVGKAWSDPLPLVRGPAGASTAQDAVDAALAPLKAALRDIPEDQPDSLNGCIRRLGEVVAALKSL